MALPDKRNKVKDEAPEWDESTPSEAKVIGGGTISSIFLKILDRLDAQVF